VSVLYQSKHDDQLNSIRKWQIEYVEALREKAVDAIIAGSNTYN